VGISAGLFLFSFRIEANFIEALDFAVGILGLDLLDDDDWSKEAGLFETPSPGSDCEDYGED
tara:strand:- start:121469 stop:121654 length:186 start_codon:yes stop_codon:yes gene_type:complete